MKALLLRPVFHLVWMVLFLILMDQPKSHHSDRGEFSRPASPTPTYDSAKDAA
ncbi:MAG: hypothetical protein HXY40_02640 [Chloroflexi bacterium]|nr:hypothetical protein [Chloroflexota bacterium]